MSAHDALARASRATPPPWRVEDGEVLAADEPDVPLGYSARVVIVDRGEAADLDFIAHARDDVPTLAREALAERARADAAEARIADLRALLVNALPHCYLAADQTVQCPECNAVWWDCPEDIDEDWHAMGCSLHRARVLVGVSTDVRRRDPVEPDKPYNPNGPAPDTRTPAQILRDTMLDGWIARLVRAKWQPVPEGVDPAAWPKAVDAMVDLILRAAPPARGGYSR